MKKLILLLSLISFSSYGQKDSTEKLLKELNLPIKSRPYLEVSGSFGLENKDLTARQLYDFNSEGFIEYSDKNEILNSVDDMFNYGYRYGWSVGYYQPSYDAFKIHIPAYSIRIYNQYVESTLLSKDLLSLLLLGNKPTAGNVLDLSNSQRELWNYTGIEYGFQFNIDSLPISAGLSLIVGHDHLNYKLNEVSFYTEPDGSFIEFNGNYNLSENNRTSNTLAVNGFGIGLSFGTQWNFKKSVIKLKVRDLGIIYWNQGFKTNADTSFVYGGVEAESILDLPNDLFANSRSQLENSLFENEATSYTSILPFRIDGEYVYNLKNKTLTNVFAFARYQYIASFTPRLGIGTSLEFNENHSLSGALAYGGFAGFGLEVNYKWQLSSYWRLNIGTNNLVGLALSNVSSGSYIQGGVRYIL